VAVNVFLLYSFLRLLCGPPFFLPGGRRRPLVSAQWLLSWLAEGVDHQRSFDRSARSRAPTPFFISGRTASFSSPSAFKFCRGRRYVAFRLCEILFSFFSWRHHPRRATLILFRSTFVREIRFFTIPLPVKNPFLALGYPMRPVGSARSHVSPFSPGA